MSNINKLAIAAMMTAVASHAILLNSEITPSRKESRGPEEVNRLKKLAEEKRERKRKRKAHEG